MEEIDGHLAPVTEALKESSIAMGKLRAADSVTQDKMTKLRTRQAELKTKVDAVVSKINGPTDIIKSEEAVDAAKTRRGNRSATYHSEVTSLVRSRSSGHP